jgi:biotin synthase
MKMLAETGVDRVSIALDAATEELFNTVKGASANGPYTWKNQLKALKEAVQTFGKGSVSTHLIAGLGENERELIQIIQWCVDTGVYPSLFAFTPIPGTALENHSQPPLSYYRRIQIARFLIIQGKTRYENMRFNEDNRLIDFGVPEEQIRNVIKTGRPFVTSGCPGCNRPYYNERPGGPLYNYPRQPLPEEVIEIEKQIL